MICGCSAELCSTVNMAGLEPYDVAKTYQSNKQGGDSKSEHA